MFGAIREFDPSIDDWNSYTEYLIANDAVSMKKKHATLFKFSWSFYLQVNIESYFITHSCF